MTSPLRLFFAIELNDEIRKNLAAAREQFAKNIKSKAVRWIPLENLHLTARFIGECSTEKIPLLVEQAQKALEKSPAFSLQLSELELFPAKSHPRVLSVAIKACPKLFQCIDLLEQAVVDAGFPAESRAYRPHLSIARFTHKPQLEAELLPVLENSLLVDHLVLFNSKQEKGKRVYEPIQIFNLVGK